MSDFIHSLGFSAVLLPLFVRITLILAAAWTCHALLRNNNPHWRILVWRFCFVGLIVVTLLSFRAPPVTLAVLPSSEVPTVDGDAKAQTRLGINNTRGKSGTSSEDANSPGSMGKFDVGTLSNPATNDSVDRVGPVRLPIDREKTAAASEEGESKLAVVDSAHSPHVLVWVTLVWACGFAWCILRLFVGVRHLAKICREAKDLPDCVAREVVPLLPNSAELSCVRVQCTDALRTPCSVGVLRHVILLPSYLCTENRRDEILAALAHELAHIRGRDLRWNFGMHIVTSMLWFHPLAWRARLAHVDACDERCDADAARTLSSPEEYVRALARIALAASNNVSAPALTMARGSSVRSRISKLDRGLVAMPVPRWQSLLASSVAVTSLLSIALVGFERSHAADKSTVAVDQYGDLLPPGALARLGSARFRHPGWYKQIAFIPNGNTFVVGTSDNTVRYWDSLTGEMTHEIDLDEDRLEAFRLSSDGSVIATLSQSRDLVQDRIYRMRLIVWGTQSHEELHRIEWQDDISSSSIALALSPNGKTVATGTRSGAVRLWDLTSGDETQMLQVLRGEVDSIEFSPNGSLLAIAGRGSVNLWEVASDKKPRELDGLARGGQVVRFTPDGTILAVGSDDDTAARLFDVKSYKLLRQLRGDSQSYYREGLCFSSDGKQLIVPTNQAKTIEFFDVSSGEHLKSLDAQPIEPRGVGVSSDGLLAAAIGSEAAIVVWDLQSGARISDQVVGHSETPYDVVYSRNDKYVVTGCLDGTIRIWDASDGRQIRVLRHDRWVAGLALSPDAKWIASCGLDNTVRFWEFSTGQEKYRFPGHGSQGGNGTTEVRFAPDGQRFYTFGMDLFLRTYDVETGRILAEHAIRPSGIPIKVTEEGTLKLAAGGPFGGFEGLSMQLDHVLLSPDGKRLFLGGRQKGIIYVFDTQSGEEVDRLELGSGVLSVAVTPDGDSLLSIEALESTASVPGERPIKNYALRLRDLQSKQLVSETPLQGSFGSQVAVSPSGNFVAVSQSPNIWTPMAMKWVDVFDVKNMKQVVRLGLSPHRVSCLEFSHDETRLAASYEDTTVTIWDLNALGVGGKTE